MLRVSTDEQRLGPDAQRAAITVWAQREGVEVVSWHLENGVSGAASLESRTVLVAAIDEMRERGAGHLVVARRDRLARDPVVAAMIEGVVERSGGRISSADGATNADTPEGVLMRRIVDAFAEYERLLIRARTRSAMAAKKARGERVGEVPYGYRLADDGRRLIEHPGESDVIRLVHELRRSSLSIASVVAECERRGIVSRSGRPLFRTQIERLLRRKPC